MEFTLYSPHPGQIRLHEAKARFRICCTGRRWGKTLACCNDLARHALNVPWTLNWWVAPVYRQARIAYRLMRRGLVQAIRSDSKTELRIELWNGSVLEFLSADNFDALRGSGVNRLVVDEASYVDREAWEFALRPALTDTKGKAIFVGTPKGRNWFYELFLRGIDPEYPEYVSFTFPTSDNPYIDPEDIEEARLTIPEDAFRQEYLAEFLQDSAGVFRNIRECVAGEFQGPQLGHDYVIGWDVAKHSDFSAISVLDQTTHHLVAWDRFNQIDYTLQISRLAALAQKYGAVVLMDSTGVGDPILEQVRRAGVRAEGYHFTNASKQQLVEHLSVQLEQRRITFPYIPELVHELELYQYEVTRAGNVRYSAPQGFHDDCVMALALACWQVNRGVSIRIRTL